MLSAHLRQGGSFLLDHNDELPNLPPGGPMEGFFLEKGKKGFSD